MLLNSESELQIDVLDVVSVVNCNNSSSTSLATQGTSWLLYNHYPHSIVALPKYHPNENGDGTTHRHRSSARQFDRPETNPEPPQPSSSICFPGSSST